MARSDDQAALAEFPPIGVRPLKTGYVEPESLIRVKIFPHERDYQPQGWDIVADQVRLTSTTTCRMYQGANDRAAGTKKRLGSFKSMEIQADTLEGPLWIDCPGPILVERGGDRPVYRYIGFLYVHSVDENLEIVNILRLEEYLRGVVPAEVSPSWPREAIKAQAVAARTYAAFHMVNSRRNLKNFFYDLDDTVSYQAFTGISQVDERSDIAIRLTYGEVLTFRQEIYPALYHAGEAPSPRPNQQRGHGQGMSQWGAVEMADHDKASYAQILHHYYPGTTPCTLAPVATKVQEMALVIPSCYNRSEASPATSL